MPWSKEVSALGCHFIGRVRGQVSLRLPGESEFISAAKIYKKARQQPMVLGEIALDQSQQHAYRTKKKDRLEVLLLLAALANWLHYMMSQAAELAGKHRSFQANSLKTRRVFSFNYLGEWLCRLARVGISDEEIQAAVRQLLEWAGLLG